MSIFTQFKQVNPYFVIYVSTCKKNQSVIKDKVDFKNLNHEYISLYK